MQPTDFPESNVTFAKDQPEYLPLPAHRTRDVTATVTSCWRFNWRERLKVLFTGRIWWSQLTFGHPLQPQRPSVDSPFRPVSKD